MAEMNVADINRRLKDNAPLFISEAEDVYHSLILQTAEKIKSMGSVRIALIAGPSGSGKTTTANLLADALCAIGEESIVVSLDDFYRSTTDPDYPLDAEGNRDFETVYALDIPMLIQTLSDIAESRRFAVPRYDFKTGTRAEIRTHEAMPHGCVIIEGLHALNPLIFEKLPEESVFKIFVSVSTNINKDGVRILSGRKIRFLRRMIRDSIYRNADAERTLSMWRAVLVGEDKYLYPNRKYADVSFNTFHPFELAVMRPFAEALISEQLSERDAYAYAVISAVRCVYPISPDLIPDTSLIREFIPGGKYEHLY